MKTFNSVFKFGLCCFISTIAFSSCLKQHMPEKSVLSNSSFPNGYFDIIKHSQLEEKNRDSTYRRIDTLFAKLTQSEYTLCHFHSRYSSNHDYSKMHNEILDELAFLNGYSNNYEYYITRKIYTYRPKLENEIKWRDCLRFLEDNDCSQDHLLNQMIWILKDTTYNFEQSQSLNYFVDSVLRRNCENVQEQIRKDTIWREKLYKAIEIQSKKFYKIDEHYDSYFYDILSSLPESHTTQYAYNYFLSQENIPDEIIDILTERLLNTYEDVDFSSHAGHGIILSQEQEKILIKRGEYLLRINKCEECQDFIEYLKER